MEYKVSDLASINKRSLKKSDYPSYIKYLDTANITRGKVDNTAGIVVGKEKVPSRARRVVQDKDIIISTVRPNQLHYGYIDEENSDLIVSTGFAVLSPKTHLVNPYYLYLALTTVEMTNRLQSIAEDSTSAYPAIKPSVIGEQNIDLPSLKIQKTISEFILSIDKKIEINQKIIANLEELSQTLFKRWFVDYEFPDENGNPYKSSGGEMYSTRLGEIPITFYPGTLKDLLNIKSGYAFKSSWWVDSGVPVIKIKDIQDNGIDLKNLSYVAPVHASKANDFTVRGGEILMALTGATVSKNYIVPLLSEPALVNQRVGLVTKSNSFKYFLLNLPLIRNEIIERAHGSAQPNVSPKNILAIDFPIPNTNTIEDFLTKTRDMYEMISIKSYENTQLARLRDYLLPKLMSGELELPDDSEVNDHEELLQ